MFSLRRLMNPGAFHARPGTRVGGVAAVLFAAAFLPGCNGDPAAPVNTDCDISFTLTMGVASAGSLQSADCRLPDNSLVDYYQLIVAADAEVQIDLTSTEFDAFLVVVDDAGQVVDANNDGFGAGSTDARLTLTLTAGTYDILANSALAGEAGDYLLLATVIPPL